MVFREYRCNKRSEVKVDEDVNKDVDQDEDKD
jgi:hypothetical protein